MRRLSAGCALYAGALGNAAPVAVAELSLAPEPAGMPLFLTEEEKEAREQAKDEARGARAAEKTAGFGA